MKDSALKRDLIRLYCKLLDLKKMCYYLVSDINTAINGTAHESNKKIKEIKNMYSGKRCFIIGNGPSLTVSDLELIRNEITFGSNSIYRIMDKTDWRPTYYCAMDEGVVDNEEQKAGISQFNCQMKFFRRQGYYKFKGIDGNCCYIRTNHSRKYLKNPQFSEDITKHLFTIGTVTYSMMQIAVYMGFTEIYLIGVDCKYSKECSKEGKIIVHNDMASHFYESKDYVDKGASSVWQHDIAYRYAEEVSYKRGFRIYNCTRGGNLEIFERKKLEDVLSTDFK